MSPWLDKATGAPVSRIDIINDFERDTGFKLTAEEFQVLLNDLEEREKEQDAHE